MDKKLKAYADFIKNAKPTPQIATYHDIMLRQFQHERLIHLIVTMFFALFMIIFLIFTTALFLILPATLWGNIITYSAAAVTLVLIITTLFYTRHYYQLENTIQSLESLTPTLHNATIHK
jgi:hypothetical protein